MHEFIFHFRRYRLRLGCRLLGPHCGILGSIRPRLRLLRHLQSAIGLGLDIVRRLVSHNDGDIDVDSRPGQTEFRVSLPIAEIERAKGRP